MGFENQNRYIGNFQIIVDGFIFDIEQGTMTVEMPDSVADGNSAIFQPIEYNATIKIPKTSRKRLIKLLMGRGLQRNEAQGMATYICKRYGFYNPLAFLF